MRDEETVVFIEPVARELANKLIEAAVDDLVRRSYGIPVTWPTPTAARLDPRKVVVGGRYVRPGDELELWDGRARVTRVEEGRMTLEVTVPCSGSPVFHCRGVVTLMDEDCALLQNDADRGDVRRVGGPNADAA